MHAIKCHLVFTHAGEQPRGHTLMSQGYKEEPREDAKSAGMPGGHPSQATYPSGMSGYPHPPMWYPPFGPQAQVNVLNMPNRPGSQAPVPRPPHFYPGPTCQGHMYSYGNPQGIYPHKLRSNHMCTYVATIHALLDCMMGSVADLAKPCHTHRCRNLGEGGPGGHDPHSNFLMLPNPHLVCAQQKHC